MNRDIGVTGPRNGWNGYQAMAASVFLDVMKIRGFDLTIHHGDCVGVDSAWHTKATARKNHIEIYPPEKDKFRAFCYGPEELVTIHDTKPYLERNVDIVDASQILIATSETPQETQRSGTWWTVRYARHIDIPRLIIWPYGQITYEWQDEKVSFGTMPLFFEATRTIT